VEQANAVHSTLKDCTGIVGHACGRHGCYVPGSIVDLQKGERQANVDWSFCEALKGMNLNGLPKVLLIYDIMCQWHKKFDERVHDNPYLSHPNISLEKAIGAFHVHGHKDDCLHRYSTLLIPGIGWIDGEILETLWSVLNNISRSTRTATLAHRAEILDDHMNDSNWKKLVAMGRNFCVVLPVLNTYVFEVSTITRKFERAKENTIDFTLYFEALTKAAPITLLKQWKSEIEVAEAVCTDRPAAMDIMKPRIPKRRF